MLRVTTKGGAVYEWDDPLIRRVGEDGGGWFLLDGTGDDPVPGEPWTICLSGGWTWFTSTVQRVEAIK